MSAGALGRRQAHFQRQLMKQRDQRCCVLQQLLQGIRVVKMYAWDECFFERIMKDRSTEVNLLRRWWSALGVSRLQWQLTPFLVSAASFSLFLLLQREQLDAATAFAALALFNVLRFPLQLLPNTLNSALEARIALDRIEDFLNLPEVMGLPQEAENDAGSTHTENAGCNSGHRDVCNHVQTPRKKGASVVIKKSSFAWPNATPLLDDVSLTCRAGMLFIAKVRRPPQGGLSFKGNTQTAYKRAMGYPWFDSNNGLFSAENVMNPTGSL